MNRHTFIAIFFSLFAVAGPTQALTVGNHLNVDLQKKHSPVVVKAVDMVNEELGAGISKKGRHTTEVVTYQLDMASNKDMKAIGSLRVPISSFITKKDAYWAGVREGKIVVVGSNGRGTAYGLLSIADMQGYVKDDFETTQIPSVEYRGVVLENFADMDYERLFRLMLRQRANTLCEGWDEGDAPSHFVHSLKNLAESYGMALAVPHGSNALRVTDRKDGKTVNIVWHDDNYGYMESERRDNSRGGAIHHLSYRGLPHDYLWLCTTQPGLIVNEMKTAYYHGASKLWLAAIHDPVVAAYQLNLFLDLAWDVKSVNAETTGRHLDAWMERRFGKEVAESLAKPMRQYYRLVGIRKPEMMDFSMQKTPVSKKDNGDGGVENSDFNAEEFGNELERYLNDYRGVAKAVAQAGQSVSENRKAEFFMTVEYPVRAAALMAEKMLQAQESRLISRPVSFHHDDEALESAAKSIIAYKKLQQLNIQYNNVAKKNGWLTMNTAPHGLAVFGQPVLTDTLSEAEIAKYGHSAPYDAQLSDDNTIVRNAAEYSSASSGATAVDLLGHSLKAMNLYNGDTLSYSFNSEVLGGVLRLAFVPTHSLDGGSLQCSVSIDGNTPTTIIITDGSHGDRWAEGVLRGQTVVTLPVSLQRGQHTLTIRALSDHVVVDQWMIDRDTDREFYVFPREVNLGSN